MPDWKTGDSNPLGVSHPYVVLLAVASPLQCQIPIVCKTLSAAVM